MMKPILSFAALAAFLLAAPTTISAQQTTFPAYDIAYYDGPFHYSEQVGQARGFCNGAGPSSYMEWGYETLHEVKVKVADCPI